MSKATITRLTDDLDGTADDSVTTIQLGWNGEWRELELSSKNRAALSKGIDRFWNAARPASSARKAAPRRGRTKSAAAKTSAASTSRDYDRQEFRTWAVENDIKLNRGRPPRELVDRFLASRS